MNNMKIVYHSMDEAVEDLCRMLPALELSAMQMQASSYFNPDMQRQIQKAIALLRNPEKLREALKAGLQPDGTVIWRFTDEAAEFLRHAGSAG